MSEVAESSASAAVVNGGVSVARIRREFRVRELTDNMLLERLAEISSNDQGVMKSLLESYQKLGGRCHICGMPTTVHPITTEHTTSTTTTNTTTTTTTTTAAISSNIANSCDDSWQVGAISALGQSGACCVIAHNDCIRSLQNPTMEKHLFQNLQIWKAEHAQLLQWRQLSTPDVITTTTTTKTTSANTAGADERSEEEKSLFLALYWAYVEAKQLLQRVCENLGGGGRWSDESKTRLLKRCHATQCCNELNPVRDIHMRRLFLPGMIDSPSFFNTYCPFRHKTRPTRLSTHVSVDPSSVVTTNISQAEKNASQVQGASQVRKDEKDEKMVGLALDKLREISARQREGGSCTPEFRRSVALSSYARHKQLHYLYLASNLPVSIPAPTIVGVEEERWKQQQSGHCIICSQLIKSDEWIQWDVFHGTWSWMHGGCNKNHWSHRLPMHIINPVHLQQKLYDLRQETTEIFEQHLERITVEPTSDTATTTKRITTYGVMAKHLMVWCGNLLSQLHLEMRFVSNADAQLLFQKLLDGFKTIAPTFQPSHPPLLQSSPNNAPNDPDIPHNRLPKKRKQQKYHY